MGLGIAQFRLLGCTRIRENSNRESVGVQLCWNAVRLFYRKWKETHPTAPLIELCDLIVKMLGKRSDMHLKVKAMEGWGLMLFVISEVRKQRRFIGEAVADNISACGQCLVDYMDKLRSCGAEVPTSEIQACDT